MGLPLRQQSAPPSAHPALVSLQASLQEPQGQHPARKSACESVSQQQGLSWLNTLLSPLQGFHSLLGLLKKSKCSHLQTVFRLCGYCYFFSCEFLPMIYRFCLQLLPVDTVPLPSCSRASAWPRRAVGKSRPSHEHVGLGKPRPSSVWASP